MADDTSIEKVFAEFGDRISEDPEGVRAEIEKQLIAENGQDWFDENKQYIDADWERALALLG